MNPAPANGGKTCVGSKRRLLACQSQKCVTTSGCADSSADCKRYSQLGYCTSGKYKSWMQINCKIACGLCGGVAVVKPGICINFQKLF